jgi:hypothetical protein
MNYLYDTYRQTGNPNAANQPVLFSLRGISKIPSAYLSFLLRRSLFSGQTTSRVTTNYVTLEIKGC